MNQKPKNKNLKYLILTFGIIILFALMFIPSMMNNSIPHLNVWNHHPVCLDVYSIHDEQL